MDEWSALETPGSSVWDQLPDGDILRVEWVKGLGPRGNQQAELLVLDIARLEHWSTQLAVRAGAGDEGVPGCNFQGLLLVMVPATAMTTGCPYALSWLPSLVSCCC
jgi:hypothetical protein